MVDINFTYGETLPAASSVAQRIAYTTGVDTNGNVQLGVSNISLVDEGALTTTTGKTKIPQIGDVSIFETMQYVATASAETIIDLSYGSYIHLTQNQATNVTFTRSTGEYYGIRFFCIRRVHDETEAIYDLTFDRGASGGAWFNENSIYHTYSQTANAQDIIFGWVDATQNVIVKFPFNAFALPGALPYGASTQTGNVRYIPGASKGYKSQNPLVDTQVAGIETGMVVTGMANMTLNACSLKIDGTENFVALVNLIGCLVNQRDLTVSIVNSTTNLNLNLSTISFIQLNQNTDITSITLTPTDNTKDYTTIIWRVKDATTTPYDIYFDPSVFTYKGSIELTQTPNAQDAIVIRSIGGVNFLTVTYNYGAPQIPEGVQ